MAYQFGRRANGLQTLLNTDPLGLETLGIAADSVTHLLDVLRREQVPPTVPGFPTNRLSDQGLLLGSFDIAPPSSSTAQAFNLTVNGFWNRSLPASPLSTAMPATSFTSTSWNGLVQAHHTAYFGVGCYGAALFAKHVMPDPLAGLAVGTVLGAVLGLATSPMIVRGTDLTRLMVTMGIALVLYELANKFTADCVALDSEMFDRRRTLVYEMEQARKVLIEKARAEVGLAGTPPAG